MEFKVKTMIPSFAGNEAEYIEKAIKANEISTHGANIDELTDLLKSYLSADNALLVCNGTAAMHLALKSLEISEGDIVFCPTYTYCGTAYPILYERAIPVFIDCDENGTLDPESLKKALIKYKDRLPAAVITVDTYGAPSDYDSIRNILSEYDIPLIADSAESLGGNYKGKKCGNLGDISIVSFSYSKLVTTSMGGAVFSDNAEYIKKAAYLANQSKAKSPCYLHKEIGYNYLLSNLLAGMGISNMKRIDTLIRRKQDIFDRYKNAFSNFSHIRMCSDVEGSSKWYDGIITEKGNADELVKKLLSSGIEVRNGFNPMHNQEAFSGFDYVCVNNNSMELLKKTVLLPSGPGTPDELLDYVIEETKKII